MRKKIPFNQRVVDVARYEQVSATVSRRMVVENDVYGPTTTHSQQLAGSVLVPTATIWRGDELHVRHGLE